MTQIKPKHVFIVEDDELYSMMLDYMLSKESIYEFVSFKTGEECIKNLYLNPDIVVLDYSLPGMNGYQVLQEIKKQNPSIHVIILSNNTDAKLAVKLLKAGADDYILKQEHGETQLLAKIETILNRDTFENIDQQRNKTRSILTGAFVFFVVIIALTVGYFIF